MKNHPVANTQPDDERREENNPADWIGQPIRELASQGGVYGHIGMIVDRSDKGHRS